MFYIIVLLSLASANSAAVGILRSHVEEDRVEAMTAVSKAEIASAVAKKFDGLASKAAFAALQKVAKYEESYQASGNATDVAEVEGSVNLIQTNSKNWIADDINSGYLAMDPKTRDFVNHPPMRTKVPSTVIVAKDHEFKMDLEQYFMDVDNDTLEYISSELPEGVTLWNGRLMGYPKVGEYPITVAATDGDQVSEESEFWIIVKDPNHPPVRTIVPPNHSCKVNEEIKIDLSSYFHDEDGDTLSWITNSLPSGLDLWSDDIMGRPEEVGNYNIRIAASDGTLTSETSEFWLFVLSEDAPDGQQWTPTIPGAAAPAPAAILLQVKSTEPESLFEFEDFVRVDE